MGDNPIGIHLKLEHMRDSVHHYVMVHEAEIAERVKAVVDDAVKRFDFDGEVRRLVNDQIRENVAWAVSKALAPHLDNAVKQAERSLASIVKSPRPSSRHVVPDQREGC